MGIERVLVATDFSFHANLAVRSAAAFCAARDAELLVLHVSAEGPGGDASAFAAQAHEKLWADHAKAVVDRLESAPTGGISRVERLIRHGSAVAEIIECARQRASDLIVIGSRGLTGASRMLLGSVAEKVSRAAPCPVLVVGEETDALFKRIVVGIDYSRFSRPSIRLAGEVLGRGGEIELFHVWYPPWLSALNASIGGFTQGFEQAVQVGRNAQAKMLEELRDEIMLDARVRCYVGSGSPPRALCDRAEEVGADLIVVGAHARETLGQRIVGTVADRVLRLARTPVLLIPDAALDHLDGS